MPPKGHANLGPSSAARWLSCPASVPLAAAAPTPPETPYAAEGTAAHALAEIYARFELIDHDEARRDHALAHWDAKYAAEYDRRDMDRHVGKYVDQVRAALDSEPHSVLLLEQRMNTGVPGVWGTGDAVVVSPRLVHVLDLKYGQGVPVNAVGNPQLRLYGLGAMNEFGDLLGSIEEVAVTVVQPRLGSVSSETLTVDELTEWRDTVVMPAVQKVEDGAGDFGPGEAACRFCPVAGECRARRDFLVARDFGDPDLLDDEEVGAELERVAQIRHWCDALEGVAFDRIYTEGRSIPGFKVVAGRGRRVITDAPAAIQTLIDAGYQPEQVAEFKVLPLGKLEKLVGRADLPELIGDYITKKEGKPSLVGEADPRPPLTVASSAAADFG